MSSEMHQLAAAYSLDALDAAERLEFEAHLATCDACRVDVASFAATSARMADAVATTPPAHLKSDVMARIALTPQLPPADSDGTSAERMAPVSNIVERRGRTRAWQFLAAAAAVTIVAVGAVAVLGSRGAGVDDVVAAPDAVTTILSGEDGDIQVVWSPTRDQVALIGSGLPETEPGFVFELWAIADGTPIPAGLFTFENGSVSDVADVGDFEPEAWGITIEPDGGSSQPTTDIIYFAEA